MRARWKIIVPLLLVFGGLVAVLVWGALDKDSATGGEWGNEAGEGGASVLAGVILGGDGVAGRFRRATGDHQLLGVVVRTVSTGNAGTGDDLAALPRAGFGRGGYQPAQE